MSEVAKISNLKIKEYEVKQSKYAVMWKLPMRGLICAPSGSGKIYLISSLILDMYRNCFQRVFIFSPSVHIDHTWEPVKKYIEQDMKIQHTHKKNQYIFQSLTLKH
jgi:hypothetical protein